MILSTANQEPSFQAIDLVIEMGFKVLSFNFLFKILLLQQ